MPSDRAIATARMVRLRRRIGAVRRRRRKIPRQVQPRHLEDAYERFLRRYLDSVFVLLQPVLRQLPRLVNGAADVRQDAGELENIGSLFDAAMLRIQNAFPLLSASRTVFGFATRIADWNLVQLGRQTRAGLGVDPIANDRHVREVLHNFRTEQVIHMKDLGETAVKRIKGLTVRAVSAGQRHESLAKDLVKEFGIAKKRARLIARNEVLTLNARVNNERLKDMGITKFTWRTVGDVRVRPRHKDINGLKFDIKEGHPTEGLPGEPVLCRCSSEPDFDGILGAV